MIGDKRITLLAFFAAAVLHLVLLVLASYTPWRTAKRDLPEIPSPTPYVVRFQQPPPIAVSPPIPFQPETQQPTTPVLPPVQSVPKQPAPTPPPVRIQEQAIKPTTIEVPRPQPVAPVKPPEPVAPRKRKPSVVKVPRKRPKRVTTPKPIAPKPPALTAPRQATPNVAATPPAQPRKPATSSPPAPPAVRPTQPVASPTPDLQRRYLAMVSDALQRHKRYPRAARRRGLSGRVMLAFVILPDGQVTDARIVESNGHTMLNNAALRALRRATPLPPFPAALDRPSLQVTIPILYELTKK